MVRKTSSQFAGSSKIIIRSFTEKDLDAVLDLSRASNSTDRTKTTWIGNNMTAMLAFDEDRLIGFIPFEKRKMVLSKNKYLNVLWVSGAFVQPEYRSKGIGTRMDQSIREYFFPEFDAVLVCREDESSPAYRWYKKLGYQPLTPIVSLRKSIEGSPHEVPRYVVWKTNEEIQGAGEELFKCFERNIGERSGFQARDSQFWKSQLETHYYRSHYKYYILAILSGTEVVSYAFIGQTQMKDNAVRFDILEMMGDSDVAKKDVYYAVWDFSSQLNLSEIRIQVAEQDSNLKQFQSWGFAERWRTNILGKLIGSNDKFPAIQWHYFHIDYI